MAQPSRARDSAGRYAADYRGISARLGTRLDLKGDPMPPEVIATENIVVHDDALGIDRQIIAGQPVPPDLVAPYKRAVGGEQAAKDPGQDARDENPVDYNAQGVDDLQAEADRRGLAVTGTGAGGNVLKADLVQALTASDAS